MQTSVTRISKAGDEAALEAFLLPRVESSMFLIGNVRLAGIVDNGSTYQGTYAARFEDGNITGVVAHYWNRNLVLQAPIDPFPLCVEAVNNSGRAIRGLIGPSDQVDVVKRALSIDGANIQLDETEKLYSLDLGDLSVPYILESGRVKGRPVNDDDIDLLTEWNIAYSIESLGAEDSQALRLQCKEDSERYTKEKRTWVLEDEGRSVAYSSFNATIKQAVQVGGVWTPPDLRRRGYGRAVVAFSLLNAREEGVRKGILFTGEENLAAQKAYENLGFRCIGKYSLLLLRSPIEHYAL